MGRTQLTSEEIGSVQRNDIDIITAGQALITKLIAGTGVTLSSTGIDSGTGDVTVNATAVAGVTRTKTTFTATAAQAAFTVPAYTVGLGLVDVIFNGSSLDSTEFTETNSTTVTLAAGAALNDKITIITYKEAGVSSVTDELSIAYAIVL